MLYAARAAYLSKGYASKANFESVARFGADPVFWNKPSVN